MAGIFESIASRSVSDLVADQVAKAIHEGTLKPGDRLPPEHELMERLNVGRTSIREGLKRLQAVGLIETRKGLGSFVARADDVGSSDFGRWVAEHRFAIGDMLDVRIALEATAAGLAAHRRTEADIARIEACHAAHRRAGADGVADDIVTSDDRFHVAVVRATKNAALTRMLVGIHAEATEFRRRTHALFGGPERSAEGHQAVLDAIKAGDARAAREAMVQHLWRLYDQVLQTSADSRDRDDRALAATSRDAFL
jgi:GntR family transcriptional repressor for pyruvate dehydrogenase complex